MGDRSAVGGTTGDARRRRRLRRRPRRRSTPLNVPLTGFPVERIGNAPISLVVYGTGVLVLALILMLRRTRSTALRLLFVGAAANVADIAAWEVGLQPTDFAIPGPTLAVFAAASLFNIVFWSTIVHILAIYPVRSPLTHPPSDADCVDLRRPAHGIRGAPRRWRFWLPGTSLDKVDRLAAVMGIVASGMLVLILASTVAGYRRTTGVAPSPGPLDRGDPAVRRRGHAHPADPADRAHGPAARRPQPRCRCSSCRSRSRSSSRSPGTACSRSDSSRGAASGSWPPGRRSDGSSAASCTTASRRRWRASGSSWTSRARRSSDDPAAAETLVDEARTEVRACDRGDPARWRASSVRRRSTRSGSRARSASRRPASAPGTASGPVIIVDVPEPLPDLPAAVEVAAYRIAVEALMNVIRHAAAKPVRGAARARPRRAPRRRRRRRSRRRGRRWQESGRGRCRNGPPRSAAR